MEDREHTIRTKSGSESQQSLSRLFDPAFIGFDRAAQFFHHSGNGFPFVSGANSTSTNPSTYTPAATEQAFA